MKRKIAKQRKLKNLTHDTAPASVGLVKEVRDELRAEIRAAEHRMNSKFLGLSSQFKGVTSDVKGLESKFVGLESRFDGLESRFEKMESKMDGVIATSHRTQVLMEEQRGENRIVLDALKTMIDRQDRVEADVTQIKDRVGL
mgnify:CR=1 FL=1